MTFLCLIDLLPDRDRDLNALKQRVLTETAADTADVAVPTMVGGISATSNQSISFPVLS